TVWSVTLSGTPMSSPTSTLAFPPAVNGSYPYTVGAVPSFTSVPASGTVVVSGLPTLVDVAFSSSVVPMVVRLTATPANVTLGNSTTLATTVTGGTTPYSYAYRQLPTGC